MEEKRVLNTFVTDVKCDMPRIGGNNTSVVDTRLASESTQVDYSLTFCCLLAYAIWICEVACVSYVCEEAKIKLMKFWS